MKRYRIEQSGYCRVGYVGEPIIGYYYVDEENMQLVSTDIMGSRRV